MKLQHAESEIISSGDFSSTNYGVEISAHMFQVLSKGLYSRPIEAIVRELCCNAWDSHIAAGNTEPFVLCLPNQLEPTFKVRDYGTGLSEENIHKIYKTYFKSTKQATDAMTGCFGLGSKSPFAYTTKFTTISYFNGMMYHYINILNDKNLPELIKVTEGETAEPNGVEVSFTVELADHNDFYKAATKVLEVFKTKPTIKGMRAGWTLPANKPFMEGSNWRLWSAHPGRDHVRGVMGNVAYPIDMNAKFSIDAKQLAKLCIDIDFDIGSFEITPSRESIQWTEFSIQNVNDKMEAVYREIREKLNAQVANASSYWDACVMAFKLIGQGPFSVWVNNIYSGYNDHIQLSWNDREIPVTGRMRVQAGEDRPAFDVQRYSTSYPRRDSNYRNSLSVDTRVNSIVLENIEKVYFADYKGALHKITEHLRHDAKRGEHCIVIVPQTWHKEMVKNAWSPGTHEIDAAKHTFDATQYDAACELIGLPAARVTKISSIPNRPSTVAKVPSKSPLKGTKAKAFQLKRGRNLDAECWEEVDIDPATGGVFVEIRNWKPVKSYHQSPYDLYQFILTAKSLLGCDLTVYGIRTAEVESYKNNSNWKDPINAIRELAVAKWKSSPDIQFAMAAQAHNKYSQSFLQLLLDLNENFSNKQRNQLPNWQAMVAKAERVISHLPTGQFISTYAKEPKELMRITDPAGSQFITDLGNKYGVLYLWFKQGNEQIWRLTQFHKEIFQYLLNCE